MFHISILTPSLNAGPWLACCAASVADQATAGLAVTHLIHDGGSQDGSLQTLPAGPGLTVVSAPDRGMYDALNQAWARTAGDYVGLLNADEQYLPGALAEVVAEFQRRPQIDVLYTGFFVVDAQFTPLCYRRPLLPSARFVALDHLPVFTCATFLRRASFSRWPQLFDTRYRAASDADWFIRMRHAGMRMGILDTFTSVFVLDGRNLSLRPEHAVECRQIRDQYASGWRWSKSLVKKVHHLRKKYHGHYAPVSASVAVYHDPTGPRVTQTLSVTGHWPVRT